MEHRGKVIRKRINEFGIRQSFVYTKLEMDKKTFQRLLQTHNPSAEVIMRIGVIIRHDFSLDFKDLKTATYNNDELVSTLADPAAIYHQLFMKQVLTGLDEIKELLIANNK